MTSMAETKMPEGKELDLAMMRAARGLDQWFRDRLPDDEPETGTGSYEDILELLHEAYRLSRTEDFEERTTDLQKMVCWQYNEMVRLCSDGAKPAAAFTWVMIVPEMLKRSPGVEWLVNALEPMSFDIEDGLFIFGTDNSDDARRVMAEFIPILRWGISTMFPSQAGITIEVWDNNINVWTDELTAA